MVRKRRTPALISAGAAHVRTIGQPYFDLLDAEKANKAKPESETRTTGLRLVSTA